MATQPLLPSDAKVVDYAPSRINPATLNVRVDNPPTTSNALEQLASGGYWPSPDQPLPILRGKLNPALLNVRVDNPPVSTPSLEYEILSLAQPDPWQHVFMGGWQSFQPRRLSPSIIAVPVNNPPPSSNAGKQLANGDYLSQPIYLPVLPRYIAATIPVAVVSVVTPFDRRWFYAVSVAWIPPDPAPITLKQLPASVKAVRVDNPPFGLNYTLIFGDKNDFDLTQG